MYMVQDGYSDYAWIFFVMLIVAGSVIIINLFLAVISNGYEKSMAVDIEAKHFSRSAKECIEFLKKAVHEAMMRPNELSHLNLKEGQKITLNQACKARMQRRENHLLETMHD